MDRNDYLLYMSKEQQCEQEREKHPAVLEYTAIYRTPQKNNNTRE